MLPNPHSASHSLPVTLPLSFLEQLQPLLPSLSWHLLSSEYSSFLLSFLKHLLSLQRISLPASDPPSHLLSSLSNYSLCCLRSAWHLLCSDFFPSELLKALTALAVFAQHSTLISKHSCRTACLIFFTGLACVLLALCVSLACMLVRIATPASFTRPYLLICPGEAGCFDVQWLWARLHPCEIRMMLPPPLCAQYACVTLIH